MNKRMTGQQLDELVRELDRKSLDALIAAANAEDRRRFDERCAEHPANASPADPCPMCGRDVKRWTNAAGRPSGKRRVRHKCPHGLWCAQGDATWGSHSNGRPPPRQQSCCGTHGARGAKTS